MLLHDDLVYQILQWLPVISLLRFKLVCRTWCSLIESNDFIKQHLHHHHHNPKMKDKNHSLIHLVAGGGSSITFALTSIDSFKEPNTCEQLDCSDLRGYLLPRIVDIVSYNGIVCLNLLHCKGKHTICLWNPATKQLRVLPQLPTLIVDTTTVGFGFDVNSNDYKVVNLVQNLTGEKRVGTYSLNTNAWRSVTSNFPFDGFAGNPKMPFSNGTCFFWLGYNSFIVAITIYFDFCSEKFRSISLPYADSFTSLDLGVIHDKIACIFRMDDSRMEIWTFNEYETVNESWTKLHMFDDPYSIIDWRMYIDGVSMDGNFIFFAKLGHICKFNVVTKETNCFTLERNLCSYDKKMVEFKESLVSVLDA